MIDGIECNLCCMLAAGRSRTHRYAELEMRTAATHSVLSVCLLVTSAAALQKRLNLDRFCLGLAQRTRYYVETRIPQEKEQF